MKIIFLDWDGVLNNRPYFVEHKMSLVKALTNATPAFDPAAVERLNDLVAATGAWVVISSSWRNGRSLTSLRGHLARRGFRGYVYGKTPDLPGRERGDEIRQWLDRHPLVTSFVVLDDDADMTAVRENFVQTSMDTGLTDDHVTAAIALLG